MIESASTEPARAAGIDGYPGPYPVGRYATRLRERVRAFAEVCVMGEVTGARTGRGPNVYFRLRDADGALPCAMWRTDFDRSGLTDDQLRDGLQVVAAGGCDYYVGSATSSPRFAFRVRELRLAGEGDLLARLARLRRQLADEGLFEPQKRLTLPLLPRRIGVVTAEGSAARRDFLAALARRSWQGTIVWAYAPVQDRRAARAIAAAVSDLAAFGGVDAIVVTRGGGSIADLWAFCDELLCRTVALTPVPVVSAVGHDVDRTLLDDVAAVCCSTPTHAADAVVGIDCAQASDRLVRAAARIDAAGRAAVVDRARVLAAASRAPRAQLERHGAALHQAARELRAATRRGVAERSERTRRVAANVIERRRDATAAALRAANESLRAHSREVGAARATLDGRLAALAHAAAGLERARAASVERRGGVLGAHAAALRAHDPDRTLERGYALLRSSGGEPLQGADAVRSARRFDVHLADGIVGAVTRYSDTEDGDGHQ